MTTCKKCGIEFEVTKGLKNYCSLSCRNSRELSIETKSKIRSSILKKLDIYTNRTLSADTKKKISDSRRKYEARIVREKKNWIYSKCLYCQSEIYHHRRYKRKYHSECWTKCSGGYREGSVTKYKGGWYNGIRCDSSWKLS